MSRRRRTRITVALACLVLAGVLGLAGVGTPVAEADETPRLRLAAT